MSFLNATSAAGLNPAEQLYQGTDYASLNWFEQQWMAWYIWIGNPIIATGLMSFLLHEVRVLSTFSVLIELLTLCRLFISVAAYPGS